MDQKNLKEYALAIYWCNLIGYFIGITWIAGGVILALKYSESKDTVYESYFQHILSIMINVFVAFLAFSAISVVLFYLTKNFIFLGGVSFLLFIVAILAINVWFIYQNITGLIELQRKT